MAISSQVAQVFRLFTELEKACDDPENFYSFKTTKSLLSEELGRFRIWSGNIGAHKIGRSSLDYRLRENSSLESMVLKLLEDLKNTLEDTLSIAIGSKTPWDDLSDDDSVISADDESYESNAVAGPPGNGNNGVIAKTELEQLLGDISEIITCLLRFSMTIRNPVSHGKFARAAKVDKSAFEPFDINHVRNKFPAGGDYLVVRLGKAITTRRRYLTYRQEHHQKLESGMVETMRAQSGQPNEDAQTQNHPLSTVASSLPAAFLNDLTLDADIDRGSEAGYSETSYASSVDESSKLFPPPLPAEANSELPYQCPICYMIIDIHTTLAWRRHVFKDLHPYVCTAKDCTTADRVFERRSEWFNHELQLHRRMWQCLQGCHETFTEKQQFEAHLRLSHAHTFNEEQLLAIMDMSESQISMDQKVLCPLCDVEVPSLIQLRKHLGRHQEQLALFALPLSIKEGDNPERENDESDQKSRASEATVEGDNDPGLDETGDPKSEEGEKAKDADVSASDNPFDPNFKYTPPTRITEPPAKLPSEELAPNCAICNSPPYPECPCEAERLELATNRAEAKFLEKCNLTTEETDKAQLDDIRDWVIKSAREDIINAYGQDSEKRKRAYKQYISALPDFEEYMREDSELPPTTVTRLRVQIWEAYSEWHRGINSDWRKAIMKYPDALDNYYAKFQVRDGEFYNYEAGFPKRRNRLRARSPSPLRRRRMRRPGSFESRNEGKRGIAVSDDQPDDVEGEESSDESDEWEYFAHQGESSRGRQPPTTYRYIPSTGQVSKADDGSPALDQKPDAF